MSGHSHWKTIKYKKGAADAQKSKAFSKISRLISVAAREKGTDPETNTKLRAAIEKARELNMPSENIERAVKRGAGSLEGAQLEEILLEVYGPGNIAIIIEGIVDNKNRALGEIKQILTQHESKLASEGSVRWMFERRGLISVDSKKVDINRNEIEIKSIESGAEDIYWRTDILEVYTKSEDLDGVKKRLEDAGLKITNVSLAWMPKEYKEAGPREHELLERLFAALDENDMVQEIYSNLKA